MTYSGHTSARMHSSLDALLTAGAFPGPAQGAAPFLQPLEVTQPEPRCTLGRRAVRRMRDQWQ